MRIISAGVLAGLSLLVAPTEGEAQTFLENCASIDGAVTQTGLTGCSNPFWIYGDGSNVTVNIDYYGSSAGNWHSMWAFTAGQISGLPASPASPIGAGDGTLLFCKFANCATNGGLSGAQSNSFLWQSNTEVIFAFYTAGSADGSPDSWSGGSWYFSGNSNRNADGQAHFALFNSNGIYQDNRSTLLAGTNNVLGVVGFEDLTTATNSDWDFNDAAFMITYDNVPTDVVPEPATMVLLATGLIGLAGAQLRRRKNTKV